MPLLCQSPMRFDCHGDGILAFSLPIGFFAYTCGRLVVVEDLHSGTQQHWLGHPQEISTLALSQDGQVHTLFVSRGTVYCRAWL